MPGRKCIPSDTDAPVKDNMKQKTIENGGKQEWLLLHVVIFQEENVFKSVWLSSTESEE